MEEEEGAFVQGQVESKEASVRSPIGLGGDTADCCACASLLSGDQLQDRSKTTKYRKRETYKGQDGECHSYGTMQGALHTSMLVII